MNIYETFQVMRSAWRRFCKRCKRDARSKLKRFLRACYGLGAPMCIFLASVTVIVIIGVVLIITIPTKRKKEAAAYAEFLAAIVTPTPLPTATPSPTPSPTPDPSESWVTRGAKGELVIDIQTRLMELGYLAIDEPTSNFGEATQSAVKLFQRQHDLQMDGIVGAQTQTLLFSEEAKAYVMLAGMEGDDIESFQRQLEELGYLEDNQITGYYGDVTTEAVKYFQRRNHLTQDGKAGEKTLETLNTEDARPTYVMEQELVKKAKAAAKAAKAKTPSGRIDKLIAIAAKQVGKPYILGKSGPSAFDCSGLAYYCLREAGVYCRRLNAKGFSNMSSWTKVSSMSALKRGDLIFFKSDDSKSVGHVGIYIGSGTMIDASSSNGKVMKRSSTGSWSKRNFVCGRRPIE